MPRVTLYIYIHIAPFAGSGPPLRRAAALILGENVRSTFWEPVNLRDARWRAYDIMMIRRGSRATGGDLRSRGSGVADDGGEGREPRIINADFGEKRCHCPARTVSWRHSGRLHGGGRSTRRRARISAQAVAARLVPRRPGGRRPVSPAEISVHSGVNEPISSGKRSPWTNGIWLSRGRA